jgi:hypothetical protein
MEQIAEDGMKMNEIFGKEPITTCIAVSLASQV